MLAMLSSSIAMGSFRRTISVVILWHSFRFLTVSRCLSLANWARSLRWFAEFFLQREMRLGSWAHARGQFPFARRMFRPSGSSRRARITSSDMSSATVMK